MKIHAELIPLIQTLNMYINTNNSENITIKIKDNQILLKTDCDSNSINVILGKNILLQTDSLSGITREFNWLSFRLRLKPSISIIDSVLGQLVKEIPHLNLNHNQNELVSKPIQLYCKCGFPLSEKVTFNKICELPSQELFSVSENWFCHLHENWKKAAKDYRLVPQQNECFYDAFSFILPKQTLRPKDNNSHDIICDSCFQNVGLKTVDYFKVWISEIKWIHMDKVEFSKTTSEIFFTLLDDLEKQNLTATPHLVLNSNKYDCLYIVIVDSCLNLLLSDCSILKEVSLVDPLFPHPKYPRVAETNILLKKITCIKVLYKNSRRENGTKDWECDTNVHIFSCNPAFFHSLLQLLIKSSECIPESLRKVEDLNIGYIMKPAIKWSTF